MKGRKRVAGTVGWGGHASQRRARGGAPLREAMGKSPCMTRSNTSTKALHSITGNPPFFG